MQRLWLPLGSLVTVLALGFGTYNVVTLIAHEEVVEEATFDATGISAVQVDNENGRVQVTGADVDEVRLVADVSHGLRRTVTEAEVIDGVLLLRGDCPVGIPLWCRVDYELQVPDDLDVDIDVDNGGIVVRDIAGDVAIGNDNGRTELSRIHGDVEVRSSNGSVDARGLTASAVDARSRNGSVRLTFAEAPTAVTARSSNGSVEVVVPDDDATYRIELGNRVGSTDAAVRTDPASERSIAASTDFGSVTIRYPTG